MSSDIEDVKVKTKSPSILSPKEIFNKLNKYVVGQEAAKRAVGIALNESESSNLNKFYKDYSYNTDLPDLPQPRLLLIGKTGTGKTHLIKSLEKSIDHRIFIYGDGSQFTGTGWTGPGITTLIDQIADKIGDIISDEPNLAENINDSVQTLSRKFVVVIDEFDKISRNNSGGEGHDYKKSVQDDLLKFIEGFKYDSKLVYTTNFGKREQAGITIDTSEIPIILLGAFDGIEKFCNQNLNNPIGFGASFCMFKNTEKNKINKDMLNKYGFMPELLGRITKIVELEPLTKQLLIDIVDTQLVSEYKRLFAANCVTLSFAHSALEEIAELALTKSEGARALREIVENQLEDYIFNISDYKDKWINITGLGDKTAFADVSNFVRLRNF